MKSLTKVLYVNSLERDSVQGRHRQVYTIISPNGELIPTKGMKKTREDTVPYYLQFRLNPATSKLDTGLDELVTNPFKDRTTSALMNEYNLSNAWSEILPDIVSRDNIPAQVEAEILDGVEPDYYTSKVTNNIFTYSGNWKDLPPPTFLEKFYITLYPNKPNKFSDTTPRGRMAIRLIKRRTDKISPTKSQANTAVHEFYISEENEAELTLAKKRNAVKEAMYNLYKLQHESSRYRNYQMAILLKDKNGSNIAKGSLSPDAIDNTLDRFISDSNPDQSENIKSFMNLMNLMTTKSGVSRFEVSYLVQQALNSNVMTIRDGYIIWHSRADTPNVYKHSDQNKLIEFLILEKKNFNPKEKEVTNWYWELVQELKAKNIWVE